MNSELTHGAQMPYSLGRTMDDSASTIELDETVGKVKTPEETAEEAKKKEDEKKGAQVAQARKDAARKIWQKQIEELERRGGKLSPEDRKKIEEMIERGVVPPSGGASDSVFERFPVEKFENTQLKPLAEELKRLGQFSQVTNERLQEMRSLVNGMVASGIVPEDLGRSFIEEVNRAAVSQEQGLDYGEDEIERSGGEPDYAYKELNDLLEGLGLGNEDEDIMGHIRNNGFMLLEPFEGEEEVRRRAQLREIFSITDPHEFKERIKPFIEASRKQFLENWKEGKVTVQDRIESIQDLAKFIMKYGESDLYGFDKEYALLEKVRDPETGKWKEVFRPDNFLIWVRDQIIQLHDDNPASEMQPLSSVALESTFRTITIYSMNRFRGQYFFDAEKGEINNALADEAVNMCYLFGFFRNMDLAYKNAMSSDEETPKTIVGIHAKNDVTRGRNWADFFSMPGQYGQSVGEGSDTQPDTSVGDAELIANDIYYNLSDLGELSDILKGQYALNTKEGFRRQLLVMQGKLEWEEPDNEPGLYDKATDTFYVNSMEKPIFEGGQINRKNYLEFINFYNEPTAILSRMNFVRGLVTMTIAQKTGLDDGFSKTPLERDQQRVEFEALKLKEGEDKARTIWKQRFKRRRINSTFAEYSSIIQQRPLMVAARNDTNRRGYDASTKLDIQNYFIRQSGDATAGPIGNTEALKHQILKNVSVDFVAGLKTENNRTPYEIFQEIRGILNSDLPPAEKQKRKAAALAQLRFRDNAAVDYSANQVNRGFQIFHRQGGAEELGLDKIVTRDSVFGIRYNAAEFEKNIKDDFLKPLRYAFSSNSALKYGSVYRGFERVGPDGMPIYKNKTLAEHMFGDEVMDGIREEYKDKEFSDFQNFLNSDKARGKLVKNTARALIAAELRKHRKLWGPSTRWNADMVNRFITALESIHALRRDDLTGEIIEDPSRRFFSSDDISWIRQNSGTGYRKMIAGEVGTGVAKGLFGGIFSSIKDFSEDVFKS